jgi:hypothetical protein
MTGDEKISAGVAVPKGGQQEVPGREYAERMKHPDTRTDYSPVNRGERSCDWSFMVPEQYVHAP